MKALLENQVLQPMDWPSLAPTEESSASWRRVVASITRVITDSETPPLIRMEANLAVARSLLSVFQWDTRHVPPALLAAR
ncbi:hypothetical protein B4Q13_16725, partial [Lacticaseibacillus rhamnosus]